MNLGGPELLILVGLAVLIFGAGWLPKAARNLGKAKVEFDQVQKQLTETKDSMVEKSGVRELEATMRKANKVMNSSPQKLMRDAAKSAVIGGSAAAPDAEIDDDFEDAEIVEQTDSDGKPTDGPGTAAEDAAPATEGDAEPDTNINVDFT